MEIKKDSNLEQRTLIDGFDKTGIILFEFFNDQVNIIQTSEDPDVEERFNKVDESINLYIDDFIEQMDKILKYAKARWISNGKCE